MKMKSTDECLTDSILEEFGLVTKGQKPPDHLQLFEKQARNVLEEFDLAVEQGRIPAIRRGEFLGLLKEIGHRVMQNPIIANNQYLKRFSKGVTLEQARHELKQFSVFAIHFDVAQAKLLANSPTLESYERRLKLLLNEKGIPYAEGFEGELCGRWKPETVHFQWLQNMAEGLGLGFADIGKIWLAHGGTKAFIDTVMETYAGFDPNISTGAALAIENWAANALWQPWICGMRKLNSTLDRKINIGYLTYHEAEENHHSQSTLSDLLNAFAQVWFDAELCLRGAEMVLNGGIRAYYEKQLETLPGKESGNWPNSAVEAPAFP